MENKRKHSETNNYARTKSKKSNTDTDITNITEKIATSAEKARGTSSAYLSYSHRVSLPTIVLNMANLQEQMSDVPRTWFDNNAVVEVPTCNNSTNDISYNYEVSDYDPDNELIIMDNNDTTKHPNEFQYSDDEFNTTSSECSAAITSVSQQDNGYDYYQTKNDDEMNNSRSNTSSECSTTITSLSQQNNDYDYYQTKNDEEINNSRSNLKTTCSYMINGICDCANPKNYYLDSGLQTPDNLSTTNHSYMFQCYDDEINTSSSECSTTITSVSHQDNGYDYYQTNNDKDTNNSSSNLKTTCSYTINGICDCGDSNKYYLDNGLRTADNYSTTKHTNIFQCREDKMNTANLESSATITSMIQQDNVHDYYPTKNAEEINNSSSKSSKGTLIRSTVLTSVREQENGCFVYLNEYDEAMNEIRSEIYKIAKPTMTSDMEQSTSSFAVISSVGYLNRYNGECTQQPIPSSEYDAEPLVILCSKRQDNVSNVLPNVSPSDDETSPKVFIEQGNCSEDYFKLKMSQQPIDD